MKACTNLVLGLVLAAGGTAAVAAGDDATELAKKLQNPVADLISVPFQLNMNYDYGPENDTQSVLNIQPVVPVSLNAEWNLITRTIVPLVSQPGVPGDPGRSYGLGDIQPSVFLSPAKPGKFIWGAGAIAQFDSASHEETGQGRWGLGPALVGLYMSKEWVVGALANNVFDVGGDGDRERINQMLVQPFVNYNFPTHPGRYLTFSPIVTANWKAETGNKWTIPLGLGIGQIIKVGRLPLNLQASYYNNIETPDFGPDYQVRLQIAALFPK